MKAIERISGGDFKVEYTHGSRASHVVHPASGGTARVQDVADGLVDMSVAPIWITAERLRMTAFTVPIGESELSEK